MERPLPPERDDAELEPMELEEAPRRAASARFEIEGDVGSEALLREAMDPANQSLADALRLSYRVLQVVIVVLIALFLISGIQIVRQGWGGVMTRFGKIMKVDGRDTLEPGRVFNLYPYPAGDFVIIKIENRSVSLADTFWPRIPDNRTLEQAIGEAVAGRGLRPGREGEGDGYVITRDGDLAHLQVAAAFEVAGPWEFVHRLRDQDADRIVKLCLKRAAVEVMARRSLQELLEIPDDVRAELRDAAQAILDSMDCGIEILDVQLPQTKPPLAIVKRFEELQSVREQARETVARARTEAQEVLERTTGNYRVLLGLVEAYQEAEARGDRDQADARLAEVNRALEGPETTGRLSDIVSFARAYESHVDSTLGNEVGRFKSLLPAYRANPELVVKTEWLDVYAEILGREDTEIIYLPDDVRSLNVSITTDEDVQKLREKYKLGWAEQEAISKAAGARRGYKERASEFELDKGRPLLREEGGRIRPRG